MRLRLTFAKTGSIRYIGHLDLHQVWERTVRRAGLPLAYTQGFHPGPKIQIACALPLGFAGRAEIVDLWLVDQPGEEAPLPGKEEIQPFAPPGLEILAIDKVDERAPALQTMVEAAEYEVTLPEKESPPGVKDRVAGVLAKTSIPRERRGKPYDLRPLIQNISLTEPSKDEPRVKVKMTLSAREGATGRPEEVLAELGVAAETAHVERVRLVFRTDVK